MSKEARAQGAEAKKLELSALDCPYGPGENRDAWMEGAGFGKDGTEQVETPPPADPASTTNVVREPKKKGKGKDAPDPTKAVTRPTPNAETSLQTVTQTAEPQEGEGAGAEAVIGDPSQSTTAAENGGEGITLNPKD